MIRYARFENLVPRPSSITEARAVVGYSPVSKSEERLCACCFEDSIIDCRFNPIPLYAGYIMKHSHLTTIPNATFIHDRSAKALLSAHSDLILLLIKVVLLTHVVENATTLPSALTLLCIEVREHDALASLLLLLSKTEVEC
jgi:hypothetical protein